MPCIYRRAALHRMGWDKESYGTDVCKGVIGELSNGARVGIDSRAEAAKDLRACLSALRNGLSDKEFGLEIMANGPIPSSLVSQYATTVREGLDEVRKLFADRGTKEIRRRAGLV